jgi:hypothetical protein
MTTRPDQLMQDIADAVLADVAPGDRAEGERLVRSIVHGWGGRPDDPQWQDVARIARDDLLDRVAKAGDRPTLDTLRDIVLEQRVADLSSRSLSLAQQFARTETPAAEAEPAASAMADEVDGLLEEVKALAEGSELRRRLTRDLADADLEVRFVLDGGEGATSIRLARALED